MKDIYSPLEIDEQWDQRAPMSEGDTTAINTYQSSGETGAATATMEPMGQVSEAIPGVEMSAPTTEVPAADTNTNEFTDTPHIELHGDAAHAEMDEQATMQQADQANDDDAIAKLSGDHLNEEATTDPTDSLINPPAGESVMATKLFTPAKPREQGTEKSEAEAQSVPVVSDTTEQKPVTDTSEHFVLGDTTDEKHTNDVPGSELTTKAEAPAEDLESMNESDDIGSKIEQAMSKIDEAIAMLKEDKEAAAAAVAKHQQAEDEARAAKDHAQQQQDKVEAELSKLESLQTAA